jgi:hypothetical protein
MAGLTANIVTSKNRAFPDWPRPYMPSESWPFYGSAGFYDQTEKRHLPGFLNFGSVGSSLENVLGNASTDAWNMHNGQATAQTAGAWNGGWAINEVWSDADAAMAWYMDRSDNKLYALLVDTGTTPDTVRMVSIDKDGNTALETAALQVTNTALDGQLAAYESTPLMYRVGQVDGTGNFRFDKFRANTPNDNGTEPFDGVRLEINTSSGTVNGISANTIAETTDGLLPNNMFQASPYGISAMCGPTDNGIMGAPIQNSFANYNVYANQLNGSLGNVDTGQIIEHAFFGQQSPFFSLNYGFKPIPWLGSYFFIGHGNITQVDGGMNFHRTDFHNFLDELAVWYGLL